MKNNLLSICLLLVAMTSQSQNLIPNPSFESFSTCPNGTAQISHLISWIDPPMHTGSADFFHSCSSSTLVDVPNNFAGTEMASSGNGYVGLALIYFTSPNFREYIEINLPAPLIAGQNYQFSFKYSLSDNSNYSTNSMGVYFSPTVVSGSGNSLPLPFVPQITSPISFTNKIGWTAVTMNYIATGGEQYLTIGNYSNDASTVVSSIGVFTINGVYIYLDDLSLQLVSPNLMIYGDSSICIGEQSTLHATGGSAYQWANSTNPTTIIGSGDSLIVSPASTTTYLVYSGSDTASYTVHVNPIPIVYLGNDTSVCQGVSLVLNAAYTGATYLWSNSSTNSTINTLNAGTYWAEVSLNGCVARDSMVLSILPLPTLNLGNDTLICNGDSILLNAFSALATYLWNNGTTNSTLNVTTSGNFWVTKSLNGCSVTDTIHIQVQPYPIVFLGNDTSICDGSFLTLNHYIPSASYMWSTGANTSGIQLNNPGTYWLNLTLNGCTSKDTIQVGSIPSPYVELGKDTSFCEGNFITLSSILNGANYLWQNGSTDSTLIATQTGVYWVQVTLNGCSEQDSINIQVNPIPTINLGADLSLCEGDSVLLNAFFPNATYSWHDLSVQPILIVNNNLDGYRWVKVELNHCYSTDSIYIDYTPNPVVNLGPDTSICSGVSLTLDAGIDNVSYLWNTHESGRTIVINQPDTYWLQIDQNGCKAIDSINILRSMDHCNCNVFVPNAFSPNGDLLNDEFKLLNTTNIDLKSFKIYNRWGELIYQSENPLDYSWNGSFKGDQCEMGTYFYIAIFTCNTDKKETMLKGDFILVK